jgi:UDPglucose 6-dehydrogenase
MKLAVIGTGYVGLVSGTCFAETGNEVICVDIDAAKVQKMQQGIVPIYEPGLESLFERNQKQGRLHFTTNLAEAVKDAQIIFLALPTPPDEDGSADLSYVMGVAHQLSELIADYKVIVDKSTVPVGTAEKVTAILAQKLDISMFEVVSNPEFLREGVAVEDFLKPDRVVVGANTEKARNLMKKLYEPFVRQGNPIVFMDTRSAEMTKYAANSYLATRISFMNEIANLCECVGANVDMVRRGIGTDFRIGKHFLYAGLGYGGSCFPKDVQALSKTAQDYQYNFKILNAVMEVNAMQRQLFLQKISSFYNNNFENLTFAIWGLSFKPNTDDVREAPALFLIENLIKMGAKIQCYDPEAAENVKKIYENTNFYPNISFINHQYEVLQKADALLLVTEWNVFRNPDFNKIAQGLKAKVIFDGRNVYDSKEMLELGFHYESVGR